MTSHQRWVTLGWRHPIWELVRYYCALGKRKAEQRRWLDELQKTNMMTVGQAANLVIDPAIVKLFCEYLKDRELDYANVFAKLRTEDSAVKACKDRGEAVAYTTTKNQEHHQSPKAVVTLVNHIARKVCGAKGVTFEPNPNSRCV